MITVEKTAASTIAKIDDNPDCVLPIINFKNIIEATPEMGQKNKTNLRIKVLEFDEPQKAKFWRRKVQVIDDNNNEETITFWNKYALRHFTQGETLMLFNAEISWNIWKNETKRNLNCWYDAMILACEGDYSQYAF